MMIITDKDSILLGNYRDRIGFLIQYNMSNIFNISIRVCTF
jgi:hypothetical protein